MSIKTKFGTANIRNDGYYIITSNKEGNNGKLLHRLIYEDFYNIELHSDIVIHHKDENKLNNEISNLIPMTKTEHMKHHRIGKKLSEETKQKMRENHPRYWKGKTFSEESRKKMSESHKGIHAGEKHPKGMLGKHHSNKTKRILHEMFTKKHARIIKMGIEDNKQVYGIIFNGKRIKRSYYPQKLIKWLLSEYPLEIMSTMIPK